MAKDNIMLEISFRDLKKLLRLQKEITANFIFISGERVSLEERTSENFIMDKGKHSPYHGDIIVLRKYFHEDKEAQG